VTDWRPPETLARDPTAAGLLVLAAHLATVVAHSSAPVAAPR
jgi:hypothetical protein